MTPLAAHIIKELTLPVHARKWKDEAAILHIMNQVHCFECSAVAADAKEISFSPQIKKNGLKSDLLFLPAPLTWIEYKDAETDDSHTFNRLWGILLIDHEAMDLSSMTGYNKSIIKDYKGELTAINVSSNLKSHFMGFVDLNLGIKAGGEVRYWCHDKDSVNVISWVTQYCYPFLMMINSPKVIGRKTHFPHRGLSKKLRQAGVITSKYPLKAWT